MKKLFALSFLFLFLFSGCAEVAMGPTNNKEAEAVLKKSLDTENVIFWSQALWVPDEFGFSQRFNQGLMNCHLGVFALTDKKLIFLSWDMDDGRYIPLLETGYDQVREIKVSTWRAQERISILVEPTRWHAFTLFDNKYNDVFSSPERMAQAEKILKEKCK